MIIGYYGKQGSGKTLLAVRNLLRHKEDFEQIISNISIKNIKIIPMDINIFNNIKELKYKKTIILWDEIQEYFNARKFMSKNNINFATFVRQIRKAGITLIWTSQFIYQVDKILRSNTEVYIKCQSNYEGMPKDKVNLDDLKIMYFIYSVNAEGNLDLVTKKILNNTSHYAKMYDSSEIVTNEYVTDKQEIKHYFTMLCYDLSPYDKEYSEDMTNFLKKFCKKIRKDVYTLMKIK